MNQPLTPDQIKLQNESLKQLEFNLVLEKVSRFTLSSLGKDIILDSSPTDDIYWLNSEHNLIEEMTNLITLDDTLPVENLSDIRAILHKSMIENAVMNTDEILSVKDVFRTSRMVRNYFRSKTEKYPALSEITSILHEDKLLEKHIDDAIDDTALVKDSASRELGRIRRDIIEKSARLRSRAQKILKRVSEDEMLMDDYLSIREGRLVLPVKVESKRQIPGIIHGISQSGSTVFLEPTEIIEMNNELSILVNEEKREIFKILQNLTKEIGEQAREFLQSVEILAHIDSITGKARYALEYGGIKPQISDRNQLYLKNARHPILVHAKGKSKVIPLSIELNEVKRGNLISGPNAGGKTVALKSIGLNVAMALSGIFPLGECATNYRTIFTAIGDNQSIENDLSTFSSQLIQLKRIIDNCESNSLILIDEIGSGTDPQEGSALAAGILDSFLNINLFFIATTHQSSLKSYALTKESIENASLEFNEEHLKPTYKYLHGVPGNSYAFVLAENIGIPGNILERARGYLGTKQTELEESIKILQSYIMQTEELKLQAEKEKNQAEIKRKEFESRFNEIKLKRKTIMDNARTEADEILKKANSLIENTIREIKEDKRAISEVKQDFHEEKNKITKSIRDAEAQRKELNNDETFAKGESVKLEDSTSIGTILETDNSNRTAVVDFNGVRFRLPFDQLNKTKPDTKKPKSRGISDNLKFDSKSSIDLRGLRVDECLRLVDEFLSDAVLGNIALVSLIHGKGTGALRAAIHESLINHPSVRSFRNGTLTEGGDGVTIIEL